MPNTRPRPASTTVVDQTWRLEPSAAGHQRLVETQRLNTVEALRVSFAQHLTPALHRGAHHMPATTQLAGQVSQRAAAASLKRHPTTRARGQPPTPRHDLTVLCSHRPNRAIDRWAPPPALVPHQPRRPTKQQQIHQHHPPTAVRPQPPTTDSSTTSRPCTWTAATTTPQCATSSPRWACTTCASNAAAPTPQAPNNPSDSDCAGSSNPPTPGCPTTDNSDVTPTATTATATPPLCLGDC